jgi:hypothetical protein
LNKKDFDGKQYCRCRCGCRGLRRRDPGFQTRAPAFLMLCLLAFLLQNADFFVIIT